MGLTDTITGNLTGRESVTNTIVAFKAMKVWWPLFHISTPCTVWYLIDHYIFYTITFNLTVISSSPEGSDKLGDANNDDGKY